MIFSALLGHATMHCNAWRLPHTLTHTLVLTLSHTQCAKRARYCLSDVGTGEVVIRCYCCKKNAIKEKKRGGKTAIEVDKFPEPIRIVRRGGGGFIRIQSTDTSLAHAFSTPQNPPGVQSLLP